MPFKVHDIVRYNYSFSSAAGGAETLQLWSAAAEVARISFIRDDAPLPAPNIAQDLNSAVASFHRSALVGLIDMLRNEKPVKVTINNQPPGFVYVHTGSELVGEGER